MPGDSCSFRRANRRKASASIPGRSKGMPNLSHTWAVKQINTSERRQGNTEQAARQSEQVAACSESALREG